MGRKDKGFTLAELLIVVAIIGVLVAISIPIFSGQLEKSREAVDAANIRSQYAEVISDALLDGTSVNGSEKYGAVQLKQKKDDWQNTELATNLHSVYAQVIGTPVANGTAWVEYNNSTGQAILHYEGGTGNTTGGSTGGESSGEGSGTTGGNTTGGSDSTGGTTSGSGTGSTGGETGRTGTGTNTGTNSALNDLIAGAGTWPALGEDGTVTVGHIYKLPDDTYYVATKTDNFNENYPSHYPNEANYGWSGVKISGTVISSDKVENGALTVTVHDGDIFRNPDGNFYIWQGVSNSSAPVVYHQWLKIVTE